MPPRNTIDGVHGLVMVEAAIDQAPIELAAGIEIDRPGVLPFQPLGAGGLRVLDRGPGRAPVPAQLNVAVVGSDPDHPRSQGGFGEGEDRSVGFGPRDVPGQASRLRVGKLRIPGGKVRTDDLPTIPSITTPEQMVSVVVTVSGFGVTLRFNT